MAGNKYFYNKFERPSLESQVLEKAQENSQTKEESTSPQKLLIEDKENDSKAISEAEKSTKDALKELVKISEELGLYELEEKVLREQPESIIIPPPEKKPRKRRPKKDQKTKSKKKGET